MMLIATMPIAMTLTAMMPTAMMLTAMTLIAMMLFYFVFFALVSSTYLSPLSLIMCISAHHLSLQLFLLHIFHCAPPAFY
jgi:hypothetical protein